MTSHPHVLGGDSTVPCCPPGWDQPLGMVPVVSQQLFQPPHAAGGSSRGTQTWHPTGRGDTSIPAPLI